MKKLLCAVTVLFSLASYAQNVGIGTNNPLTKLDVNGALSARITTKPADVAVSIPDDVTLFRLTNVTGGTTTTLSLANPKDGQFLTIINEDDNTASFNGYSIPGGSTSNPNVANFVNVAGAASGWKLSGIQYITDISAANGLTHQGTSDRQVKLGGTLSENTTIALNSYNMNFTGSGNVGIGQATPTQKLEVKDGNILISNANGTAGQLRLQGTGTGVSILKAGAQGAADVTYTLPLAQASSNGLALINDGTGNLSWGDPTSGSTFASASQDNFEDFLFDSYSGSGNNDNQYAFTRATSGSGSRSDVDGTVEPSGNNYAGIHILNTGTSSSGKAAVGSFNLINRLKLGGKQVAYEARVRIETLSTSAQTFTASYGLTNTDLAAAANGVYFTYTHGTNSGNWTCNTRASSTSTNLNSGVAVTANQWYKLKAVINAAGTQADFYVNGTLVGSSTTNIPTAALKFVFKIEKSAGSTARTTSVDYISWRMVR